MEFISVSQEIRQIVSDNLETPSQLKRALKNVGYKYYVINRKCITVYVMKPIKADINKPKVEFKL